MGIIVIRCPKTKKIISTGIGADQASFQTMNITGNSVECPEFKKTHVWDKKDAWVHE